MKTNETIFTYLWFTKKNGAVVALSLDSMYKPDPDLLNELRLMGFEVVRLKTKIDIHIEE